MKRLGTVLVIAILCLPGAAWAAGSSPGGSAASAGMPPRLAAHTRHAHRLDPILLEDAHHDRLLVMGAPGPHGRLSRIVVVERRGSGSWSRERVLATSRAGVTSLSAAMAPGGRVVVVWAEAIGGDAHVRVRTPHRRWTRSVVLKGVKVYDTPQVVVDGHGSAAVAADQGSGSTKVAVLRSGHWRMTRFPGFATPSIGMDRRGTVYGVATDVQHGGRGDASEARLPAGGHWSRSRLIGGVGPMVQSAQLVVSPGGDVTLAVGYASDSWVSTLDGDYYFPTAYAVLRQPSWGATPHVLWRRDGAVALQLRLAPPGGLVATWAQWQDPERRRPSRIALQQARLTATRPPAAVVQLDHRPASVLQGSYTFGTTPTATHRALTWWRGFTPHARYSTSVHLARVTDRAVLDTSVLAGSADRGSGASAGAAAVLRDGTAAWPRHIRWHHSAAYGWDVTDAQVAVGHVRP